jgi:hypothetical protein
MTLEVLAPTDCVSACVSDELLSFVGFLDLICGLRAVSVHSAVERRLRPVLTHPSTQPPRALGVIVLKRLAEFTHRVVLRKKRSIGNRAKVIVPEALGNQLELADKPDAYVQARALSKAFL